MSQHLLRALTAEEKEILEARRNSANREEGWRAEVVLLGAEGKSVEEIAQILARHPASAKKWIKRFNQSGLDGLVVKKRGPREGPRPSFTREQVEKLKELSRVDPASLGFGFRRWTAQKLANAARERGIVKRISHVTVQQILKRQTAGNGVVSATDEAESKGAEPFATARLAYADSNFDKAIECCRAALAVSGHLPDQEAEIRLLLSEALDERGRFDEAYAAVEDYEDSNLLAALGLQTKGKVKLRIGWVHSLVRNYPLALSSINEAKEIFEGIQDDRGVGHCHFALGRTYISISEFTIAREHLHLALGCKGAVADLALAARIHLTLSAAEFYEGALAASRQNAARALELAEKSGNLSVTGVALLNLGVFYNQASERKQSIECMRRAIAIFERINHRELALAYNNLGDNLRLSGDWEQAAEALNRAVETGQRFDQRSHLATALVTSAEILGANGRFHEAEERTNSALDLARQLGDSFLESYGLRIMSWLHYSTARIESGMALLQQALRVSMLVGEPALIILSELMFVEFCLAQGHIDQAREYMQSTRERLTEENTGSPILIAVFQRLNGRLDGALGHYAEGKQHIAQSISIFKKSEMPYEEARSHLAMGELLKAGGAASEAEFHLKKAKDTFDALNAEPDARRAARMLESLWTDIGAGIDLRGPSSTSASDETRQNASATHLRKEHANAREGTSVEHTTARAISVSDALVMRRLIEASSSKNLLLQELASVVYENFHPEAVVICRRSNSGVLDPIVSQGISLEDARSLCGEMQPNYPDFNGNGGGSLVCLKSGTVGLRGESGSELFLYLRSTYRSPFDPARLQPLIMQTEMGLELCTLREARSSAAVGRSVYPSRPIFPGFIVASNAMSRVIERIQKIKTSDVTVLITGESGTGKELVARAIHAESARASAIFLPFNCSATPRDLIESQLFGHRRGAFTGATGNYLGMIRAADGGTLFLDEVGDLALDVQPKLMRFLQEGEIQPLGELRPAKVDVRVIAATNADLERSVEEGRFRKDLFHRLNIIRIHVPALRARREEIGALASFFLDNIRAKSGKEVSLAEDAMESLRQYDWPGNVRQLRNEMERLSAYASPGDMIRADDLSPEIVAGRHALLAGSDRFVRGSQDMWGANPGQEGQRPKRSTSGAATGNGGPARLKDLTAALELRVISEALARNQNNLSKTAEELGLSRRGLRLKLAQLGIDRGKRDPVATAAD